MLYFKRGPLDDKGRFSHAVEVPYFQNHESGNLLCFINYPFVLRYFITATENVSPQPPPCAFSWWVLVIVLRPLHIDKREVYFVG